MIQKQITHLLRFLRGIMPALLLLIVLAGCRTDQTFSAWSWEKAEAGLPRDAIVLTIAADPDDPLRLWAGVYDSTGFVISRDGGQSWQTNVQGLDDNPVFDLLPVKSGPDASPAANVWAATRDGLYRSEDAGESWAGGGARMTVDANGRCGFIGLQIRVRVDCDPRQRVAGVSGMVVRSGRVRIIFMGI